MQTLFLPLLRISRHRLICCSVSGLAIVHITSQSEKSGNGFCASVPGVEHLAELLHGAGDDAGDGEGKSKIEGGSLVSGQLVRHWPVLMTNMMRIRDM